MKKLIIIAALAVPMLISACGGNQSKTETEEVTTSDTSLISADTVSTTTVETASNIVQLSGNDQMKFSTNEIKVKADEKVTITFKNEGTLPKEAMGHNFVLLASGTDLEKFAMKAMVTKATDYIPATEKSSILAHTKLLGPGESDTIEFTVPKGVYTYICTFPGHYGTMQGKLIVE